MLGKHIPHMDLMDRNILKIFKCFILKKCQVQYISVSSLPYLLALLKRQPFNICLPGTWSSSVPKPYLLRALVFGGQKTDIKWMEYDGI